MFWSSSCSPKSSAWLGCDASGIDWSMSLRRTPTSSRIDCDVRSSFAIRWLGHGVDLASLLSPSGVSSITGVDPWYNPPRNSGRGVPGPDSSWSSVCLLMVLLESMLL